MSLSERQQGILTFIRAYVQEHNYPPTIREIGKAVGISSTSVVKYNLERLEDKHMLDRSEDVSRGLSLRDSFSPVVRVPKLGIIAAGIPIPAVGQQDNPFAGELLTLTQDLVPDTADIFALRVKGDSMIDALVNEGDWVVVHAQETAQPRDMVVAWLKDREETTLKYYYPEGSKVRLEPANPAYRPIFVPADQVQIQGKVLVVVRQP